MGDEKARPQPAPQCIGLGRLVLAVDAHEGLLASVLVIGDGAAAEGENHHLFDRLSGEAVILIALQAEHVTGEVDPSRVWTNAGARAGDQLFLTKPLGTGVIATAIKFDRAPERAA